MTCRGRRHIILKRAPIYRAVGKADDNQFAQRGALGKINGDVVDIDALARDVRKFAQA